MNRATKIASRIGTVLLCLVLAVAVIFLVFQVFASKGRSLPGGYRPLIVLSGSMEPAMPVGSAVLTKRVSPTSVGVGDIITFAQGSDSAGTTRLFVTHRVVRVIEDEGQLSFVTKGDANNTNDQTAVSGDRLIGRVVLVMPLVGHLTEFVRSPIGLILMVLLPGAILIAWEGFDLIRRRRRPLHGGGTTVVVVALCALGIAQVNAAAGALGSTDAYLATRADSLTASVSTGYWQEPPQPVGTFALSPGKAKAVRHDGEPGRENFPIASIDPVVGALALDFGEVRAGNSNNSVDVFRIKNTGDHPIEVAVAAGAELEQFVSRIGGKDEGVAVLQPGEEYSVDIKLDIDKSVSAGDHRGSITVSIGGQPEVVRIPALITVIEGGSGNGDGNGNDLNKSQRDVDDSEGATAKKAPGTTGSDRQPATTTTTAVPDPPDDASGEQVEGQGDGTGKAGGPVGDPQPGPLPEQGANVETTLTTAVSIPSS